MVKYTEKSAIKKKGNSREERGNMVNHTDKYKETYRKKGSEKLAEKKSI